MVWCCRTSGIVIFVRNPRPFNCAISWLTDSNRIQSVNPNAAVFVVVEDPVVRCGRRRDVGGPMAKMVAGDDWCVIVVVVVVVRALDWGVVDDDGGGMVVSFMCRWCSGTTTLLLLLWWEEEEGRICVIIVGSGFRGFFVVVVVVSSLGWSFGSSLVGVILKYNGTLVFSKWWLQHYIYDSNCWIVFVVMVGGNCWCSCVCVCFPVICVCVWVVGNTVPGNFPRDSIPLLRDKKLWISSSQ